MGFRRLKADTPTPGDFNNKKINDVLISTEHHDFRSILALISVNFFYATKHVL